MAIKFDDFLSKKKEPAQVLDLSHVRITSKEEFRKYFDRIPEYKIKPEKVPPESIKIRDKDFAFTPSRREGRITDYNYLDPTPPDMKSVHLEDLCPVSIDWKMLTTLRPKTKLEEDMFSSVDRPTNKKIPHGSRLSTSVRHPPMPTPNPTALDIVTHGLPYRLVQLGKLDLKYQQNLKRGKDTDWIRRTKKPRSSIVETRVLSCKLCGEDFCDSSQCCKMMYENFFRIQPAITTGVAKDVGSFETEEKSVKVKKRRGRKRTRSVHRRKLRKNSIFNRPASQGCNKDHSRGERSANSETGGKGRSLSCDRGRARSKSRRKSASPVARAHSAPRIHFKIEEQRAKKPSTGFTSDSAVSQSDYSSHSESRSPARKVEFADSEETSLFPRKSFLRKCTLSDANEWSEAHKRVRRPFTTGDWNRRGVSSDDSDSSLSPDRFKPLRPSTIKLEFEPHSPNKRTNRPAHLHSRLPGSKRMMGTSSFDRQEVRKLTQGLSRIELAFSDEGTSSQQMQIRRRTRLQKSTGIHYSPPSFKPESTFLQGTGLLQKH